MIHPKCSIETPRMDGGVGYEFCENKASTTVIWKDGSEEKLCGKCFSSLRADVYDVFEGDIYKITHHNKKNMNENVCPKCNGDRAISVLDESGNLIFIFGIKYMMRCTKCNGTGSIKGNKNE